MVIVLEVRPVRRGSSQSDSSGDSRRWLQGHKRCVSTRGHHTDLQRLAALSSRRRAVAAPRLVNSTSQSNCKQAQGGGEAQLQPTGQPDVGRCKDSGPLLLIPDRRQGSEWSPSRRVLETWHFKPALWVLNAPCSEMHLLAETLCGAEGRFCRAFREATSRPRRCMRATVATPKPCVDQGSAVPASLQQTSKTQLINPRY